MTAAKLSSLRARADAQGGAVLVTSLLMLLVLTIIGVTAMQMSRMQERMSGNARDLNLGFQGAEAAIRAGEAKIGALSLEPATCSTKPCEYWLEGSIGKDGRVEMADAAWWTDNGYAIGAVTDLKQQPLFVIEELGFVRTDGEIEVGAEPAAGRMFYQVSGRSTGGSGLTETVLQTTYTRRF